MRMAVNWDTRTADNCKLPDLIPEICENCRDIQYCKAKERGKQMTFDDFLEPETFSDYIGRCEWCAWSDGQKCKWDDSYWTKPYCVNKDAWLPSDRIPRLCCNCKHSNCFHYNTKAKYEAKLKNGYSKESANDPEVDNELYCTRNEDKPDAGSVNRSRPYIDFVQKFGAVGIWHRDHEWDTCDAWEPERR